MNHLHGKTALITGGSKGIGYGIAESLLKEGMNVAITSRHQETADAAARQLSAVGPGKLLAIAADVRDFDAQKDAVAKTLVLDRFGDRGLCRDRRDSRERRGSCGMDRSWFVARGMCTRLATDR